MKTKMSQPTEVKIEGMWGFYIVMIVVIGLNFAFLEIHIDSLTSAVKAQTEIIKFRKIETWTPTTDASGKAVMIDPANVK